MQYDNDEEDGHDACSTDSSSRSVHFYQYHIVYLPSYSVPVLLFKAYNEGKLKVHDKLILHAENQKGLLHWQCCSDPAAVAVCMLETDFVSVTTSIADEIVCLPCCFQCHYPCV